MEIFKIHTGTMKVKKDVDLPKLAALTENATGADIKAICSEAGMFAARKKKKAVEMEEFEAAIKKVKTSKQWDYLSTKEAGVMFA